MSSATASISTVGDPARRSPQTCRDDRTMLLAGTTGNAVQGTV